MRLRRLPRVSDAPSLSEGEMPSVTAMNDDLASCQKTLPMNRGTSHGNNSLNPKLKTQNGRIRRTSHVIPGQGLSGVLTATRNTLLLLVRDNEPKPPLLADSLEVRHGGLGLRLVVNPPLSCNPDKDQDKGKMTLRWWRALAIRD